MHSLVPIALVYVAAHYLTFLLLEGQGIAYLLSDPLGRGWDLFGTASSAVDYGLISQNRPGTRRWRASSPATSRRWCSPTTARWRSTGRRAPPRARNTPCSAIMVGFTTLALWLLAQAGTA